MEPAEGGLSMITTTPLEDWLASRRISIREARAICAKKHCASAFDTLICHPYTLPKLALAVARALSPGEVSVTVGGKGLKSGSARVIASL